MLFALVMGSVACTQREANGDDMDAEPVEHSPELVERYEQACEDWCTLIDECGLYGGSCSCEERDFSGKHELCLEKATLRLECMTVLTCEEADRLDGDSVQDRPCLGEGIAETAAC